MKLYRVSFDTSASLNRTFVPMIPESAGLEEDKTIKRVCLSSSIEGCLQAIPRGGKDISVGTEFIVYEAEINTLDENLIFPEEVRDYVPDALENEEYWYMKELHMTGKKVKLTNFDYSCELAFTAVDEDDFIARMLDTVSEEAYKYIEKVSDIMLDDSIILGARYHDVIDYLFKIKEYKLIDDIYDAVALTPWAQIVRFSNVEYA